MRSPRLTQEAIKAMDERFKLQHEAVQLLGLVVAEWKTDPMSVQCFDLRTVERARVVCERLEQLSFY